MKTGAEILRTAVITAEGQRTGSVVDLLFDDDCRRVLALVVEAGRLFRNRRVISFDEVRIFGPDVVTLDAGAPGGRLMRDDDTDALRSGRAAMQGRPVVSAGGRYVGPITDVLFDEVTGRVLGFEVASRPGPGKPWRRIGLPADLTAVVAGDGVLLSSTGWPRS